MADNVTTSDLVLDPQVLADMLSANLTAGMKFLPIAQIDATLQGRPGSTVEFPSWNYIGDADSLAEGEGIETAALSYGSQAATIQKIAKGVSITDEAVETGYGDPYGEGVKQLNLAINNKLDNDVLATLQAATQKATVDPSVEGLQDGLDVFNDEDNSLLVLVCSPKAAGKLRLSAQKDWLRGSQLGAEQLSNGVYGSVLGVQVIRSKKLNENEAYLVKAADPDDPNNKPAVKLMLKRGVTVKLDEQPKYGKTDIYATALAAPYLYDPTKVVKLTFNGLNATGATNGAPAKKTAATTATNVADEKKIGRGKKKAAAQSSSSSSSATPGKA